MTVFISYARTDEQLVHMLHGQLELQGHPAFFDHEMVGGQLWWDVLLEQIRTCSVFLFVLSPDSINSRACAAELKYAVDLDKRLLAVMVREVPVESAPDAFQLSNIQNLTYPDAKGWYKLDDALDQLELEAKAIPNPEHLAELPPPPIADLSEARAVLESAAMSTEEQRDLLADFTTRVEDPSERRAVVALVEKLRDYPDVLADVKQQASALISEFQERSLDARSSAYFDNLVDDFKDHNCTPILGSGLTDWLWGTRTQLAQLWAQEYQFPLGLSSQEDLPQVAQFLAVRLKSHKVRSNLATFYRDQLKRRFPDVVGDTDAKSDLDQMIIDVWDSQAATRRSEPHKVLAATECPVYVTTQATALLTEALIDAGREPVVDFCRWNLDVAPDKWPVSPLDEDPDYEPSPERPLVYHVFGLIDYPESIVITEDDYFEFLAAVSQNEKLIPRILQDRMNESSLLFVGFGPQDWDVRILLRGLMSRETIGRRSPYQHVAAVMNERPVSSPEGARSYVEQYFEAFREPPIQVLWSSVSGFFAELEKALGHPA